MERRASRSKTRIRLLLLLLAILLVIALFSGNWLAAIPNSRARKSLASRDAEGALTWLRLSLYLSERNPETQFLLARAHRRQGAMDLVQEHLLRAANLGWPPEQLDREQWLALAQSGQMEAAGPHLAELLRDPRGDGAEICEAYVIGAVKMHQLDVVERLLSVWIEDFPDDPQPYFLRGVMSQNARFFEEGERDLRRALQLKPDHTAAALSLAEVFYEQSKTDQALHFFQSAERGPQERTAALIGQARCWRALQRPKEARAILKTVLASSGKDLEALIEMGRLEVAERNYRAAIELLEPEAERAMRNREFRLVFGTALGWAGRKEEAKSHLEYAKEAGDQLDQASRLMPQVASQPRDPDLRWQIGKAYLEYGFPKDGLTWLESALQCDPGHKPTHAALAAYYRSKIGEGPAYAELAERHRLLAGE